MSNLPAELEQMYKSTLVTGACGFIGSHLERIGKSKGIDFTTLDKTGEPDIKCDITDADWNKIGLSNFKTVIHLAAKTSVSESLEKLRRFLDVNSEATRKLFRASVEQNVERVIFASSAAVYGSSNKETKKVGEEGAPSSPYAESKLLGEEFARQMSSSGTTFVCLRFFNVYGPRSRTSGTYGAVFGVFLGQKISGKPYTVVGDGEQTRDFTFVTDIANAILTSAKSDRVSKIYNVGSGATVSVNRLVELLGGEKVHIPKRPGEPESTFADISKIRSELGWEPQVSIEDGVAEILKHIDYWKDAPVWTPDRIADATADWFRYLS